MIKQCFSCGVEKDLGMETVYPYKDTLTQEVPIPQLLTIECQPRDVPFDGDWDFRMAVMCHDCWHRLSATRGIDMWIGQECWESLTPVVPFDCLPPVQDFLPDDSKEADDEKWNSANYTPLPKKVSHDN